MYSMSRHWLQLGYNPEWAAEEASPRAGTDSQAKEVPPSLEIAKGERVLKQAQVKTTGSVSVDWTVAGADALVAVGVPTGRLCRILQCRLEIPRVAVLIERQAHHTPEVPG